MRALITGANGDIGYAILKYLLDENFNVVALDKKVNRLEMISQSNKNLTVLQVDLSDSYHIQDYLENLDGPFDTVIYAAGIREIMPFANLSVSEWQAIIAINLTGAFVISQYAAKLAIKNNHSLCMIYISSISGLYGEPERSAYCASKHGLIGLAKSLAIELASHEIRVNVIAPGIIETDLTRPYRENSQVMEQINKNIPLLRWGQPHHIVKTIDLIIKNDYLTGSTLVVDGGWTSGKRI